MSRILALHRLRRLFSQDVARANAAQASVRMQHLRRERRDLDAYLDEKLQGPIGRPSVRADARAPTTRPGARGGPWPAP